jgi:hypothetical protein
MGKIISESIVNVDVDTKDVLTQSYNNIKDIHLIFSRYYDDNYVLIQQRVIKDILLLFFILMIIFLLWQIKKSVSKLHKSKIV